MKYTYATLLLKETDAEINEHNLTDVLDAAGAEITASRTKAYVAALEDVAIDEHTAAAQPQSTGLEPSSEDGTDESSASTVGASDEVEDGTAVDELASESTDRGEASETR